jgi:hypothetical protein
MLTGTVKVMALATVMASVGVVPADLSHELSDVIVTALFSGGINETE